MVGGGSGTTSDFRFPDVAGRLWLASSGFTVLAEETEHAEAASQQTTSPESKIVRIPLPHVRLYFISRLSVRADIYPRFKNRANKRLFGSGVLKHFC